jgi:DNA polymerase alpha subunit A
VRQRPSSAPPPSPLPPLPLPRRYVDPASHKHHVLVASLVEHRSVAADVNTPEDKKATRSATFIRPPPNAGAWVRDVKAELARLPAVARVVTLCANERALLDALLGRIAELDPDALAGHNIGGFDLDVLLARMKENRVQDWSRIGRQKRRDYPWSGASGSREQFTGIVAAGRLVVDTYTAAQEFGSRETTYGLTALAASKLGFQRHDVFPEDVPKLARSPQDAIKLCLHTDNDAWLTMRLMFKLQVRSSPLCPSSPPPRP